MLDPAQLVHKGDWAMRLSYGVIDTEGGLKDEVGDPKGVCCCEVVLWLFGMVCGRTLARPRGLPDGVRSNGK